MFVQFKFYNDEEDLRGLTGDDLRHVSIDLLHAHMDPFFNECRSYGKLIEKNLNGKVAVHCYGYITLPAKREDELKSRFNIEEWDRPGNHYTLPHSRRPPLRAIVKQLIREEVPLTQKSAAKMLRDLKSMRRAGVYPIDVHERNYKGGLLVDMSIAMVKPHFLFDIRPPWQVADMYKSDDLRNFQTMIDNAGINSTLRTMPNREYKKKLRSYRAP